ncbi:MAG: undecaprenyl-phosphate glucose phosphotransferase [Geminicoccaceae bacterium]
MVVAIEALRGLRLYELGTMERLSGPGWPLGRLLVCVVAIWLLLESGLGGPDRGVWGMSWALSAAVGLIGWRILVARVVGRWRRAGHLTKLIAVVGAGEPGQRLVERLLAKGDGLRITGIFDDRRHRVPRHIAGVPVLGSVDDLVTFARTHPLDQVLVALPWHAEARLAEWMSKLSELPVDVRLAPSSGPASLPVRGLGELAGMPVMDLQQRPLVGWAYLAKAAEDRILAAAALVATAPLLLAIAVAVRLSSSGPVLYRQQRFGFNNQPIEVLKFRTMLWVAESDRAVPLVQASRGDPRVTPIGRWLRRTSLDELPQLINVVRGEMSLVGPRPHAIEHNEHYARTIDRYLARHRVKPCITGWAQINGLRGETRDQPQMEQRLAHDLAYIETWSILLDLRILARTLLLVWRDPNAY